MQEKVHFGVYASVELKQWKILEANYEPFLGMFTDSRSVQGINQKQEKNRLHPEIGVMSGARGHPLKFLIIH